MPRPAIRLILGSEGEQRAVGVQDPELDVTEQLYEYTRSQFPFIETLSGFVLKRASPSCGMERVKLYNDKGMPEKTGSGRFAATMMEHFPELPVEEEGRLGDPRLRENFVQRVFIYDHWRRGVRPRLSVAELTGFHARMKLTLMSHDQDAARELGRLAASARKENLETVANEYIATCMATLSKVATRRNHVNVLQHIQGYLKQELDSNDKAELVETIEAYGQGDVPLVVPVTLLKHHFRKAPDPYIEQSWYMSPYPASLRLRNMV